MLETICWILMYSTLAGGAILDPRIAWVGCVLIGPVVGIMFIGGLIVCGSDAYRWLRTFKATG